MMTPTWTLAADGADLTAILQAGDEGRFLLVAA
jgi:hypothetical protein